ncbi:MAG TPA: CcoQ/FixQ family Cbb3-type cytochrome c oxidase assembly chaperone [Verrucomicrobiae bacterium]
MYQNVLAKIDGIGLYGVISISIFFAFFTGMLLWACLQKRNHLNRMSALPLDAGEKKSNDNTKS